MLMKLGNQSQKRLGIRLLSGWYWIVPILLIVAWLAIRQIDLYPPTSDEFFSLYNAGGIVNTPYSPDEIIQSIQVNSPQHTPAYFFLLSVWGNNVNWEIAIARIPTIFAGILSLTMVYRLAKDFVSPLAGGYAFVIMASNAFYHFYFSHARMYPFLVLLATIVLWFYLRILYKQQVVKWWDYVALLLATYSLINTHIFSVTFLFALGIYHLIFVPKNHRWLMVSVTIGGAILLFSPYLSVLGSGVNRALINREERYIDGTQAIVVWLRMLFNGDSTLLGLTIFGLFVGIRQQVTSFPRYLLLSIIYLFVIGVIAYVIPIITEDGMRYLIMGWIPFILLVTWGLIELYHHNKWTIIILLFWIFSGISFHTNTIDWEPYIAGRTNGFGSVPHQVISRLARQQPEPPIIIGYKNFEASLNWGLSIDFRQYDYYFERHDIIAERATTVDEVIELVRLNTIAKPVLWISYRESISNSDEVVNLRSFMQQNYERCNTIKIGVDSVIEQYFWDTLNCKFPSLTNSFNTSEIDYGLYTTTLDAGANLVLVDKWSARNQNVLDDYNFSYQLITSDWEKVAQLDLPMVEQGNWRQISMDIQDVAPGEYRLIGIMYNSATGEKLHWLDNTQELGDILTLSDVIIPSDLESQ